MGKAKQYLIETKEFWKEIYELAVNLNTGNKLWDLLREVQHYFYALEPFSYKFQRVKELRKTSWGSTIELWIGTWVVEKSHYQKKGHPIREPHHFAKIIQEHGIDLVPYVRRPIREIFHKLVLETKALKFYKTITVSRPFNAEVMHFSDNLYCRFKDVFTISSQYPERVDFSEKAVWGDPLFQIETMIQFEDHLDILKDAYNELHRKIQMITDHNKPILERMKKMTTPFRLAKRLKS